MRLTSPAMRWPAFVVALVLTVAWSAGAQAATVLGFYSHPWGVAAGVLYFPHAFITIDRTSNVGGAASHEAYGFTAISPNAVIASHKGAGRIGEPDPRYAGRTRLHFRLAITDAEYAALKARIAAWGPDYDLDRHNCVSFVAEMARAVGLSTPDRDGRDPGAFLDRLRRQNIERIEASTPAGAVPVH